MEALVENWTKHDLDSRLGLKMSKFYTEHGFEGYGFFWVLIEILYREKGQCIEYSDKSWQLLANPSQAKRVQAWVDSLLLLGLLERDQTHFWSPRVVEEHANREKELERKRQRNIENGRLGGLAKASQAKRPLANLGRERVRGEKEKEERESITGGEGASRQPPQLDPQAPLIDLSETEYKNLVIEFSEEPVKYYLPVCTDWLLSKGKGPPKSGVALLRNWIRKDKAERKGFYYPPAQRVKNGIDPNGYSSAFNKNMETRERLLKLELEAEGKI